MATEGLLNIKVFLNKCYDVISFIHGITSKMLSHDLNYIVDVVMSPKLALAFLAKLAFHFQ